jgi:hypothetical protein
MKEQMDKFAFINTNICFSTTPLGKPNHKPLAGRKY